MFGLFLLYFIGEKFYRLAATFDRNKWGFAILGVVSYYVGTFIFGALLSLALELWSDIRIEEIDSMLLGILAIPVGLLSCSGLYKILEKNWERNLEDDPDILDNMDI